MKPKKAETDFVFHDCFRLGSLFFVVDLRSKAHYQHGHCAHQSGFKLATCAFVLSILDIKIFELNIILTDSHQ